MFAQHPVAPVRYSCATIIRIRRADTILVVEGGRIVERGRHQELLAAGGRYSDHYTRQF